VTTPRSEREPHRSLGFGWVLGHLPGWWYHRCLIDSLPLPLRRFTYRKGRDELYAGEAETMNPTKTTKMKSLAVGAAMTLVLCAGATALLMPAIANAAAEHHTDDMLAQIRHNRTKDTVSPVRQARQGADDTLGHLRHSGVDDTVGHLRSSGAVPQAKRGADDTLGHVRRSGVDDTVAHAKYGADDAVGHL
jgi:hypothetical protein